MPASPSSAGSVPLTFGSLFCGIGGFDLGFERAGLECRWQVEIDPFCQRVLEKHWPHVQRFDDVRECCAGRLRRSRDDQRCAECGRRHCLPYVDVLCGGFPCQDISVAGPGEGIDGARSGLWSEYARLIGELRPRYVVVENVSALLGRGLGRVLGDLAARGYDAEWDCLPASAFGAPHQRDRIWLVAYPERRRRGAGSAVRSREGGPLPEPSGPGEDVADAMRCGCGQGRARRPLREDSQRGSATTSDTDSAGLQAPRAFTDGAHGRDAGGILATADWWRTEPNVGRVANGVPARVDRLRGLGNAIVPQIAEWIGRRLIAAGSVLEGAHE